MKINIITFLLVLLTEIGLSQSNSDTTSWAKKLEQLEYARELKNEKIKFEFKAKYQNDINKNSKELGLSPIQENKSSFHIRIWTAKQCFDIQLNNQGDIIGQLTNYAVTVESKTIVTTNELDIALGQTTILEKKLTKNIYSSFKKLYIDTISSMEKIPFWNHGQDGSTIIIEQMINGKYEFKFYWSAHSVEDNRAKQIETFENNFYSDYLTLLHKSFFKTLPIGCYYYGGQTINCRTKNN